MCFSGHITGFALLGHAAEMAAASSTIRMVFDAESIPLLPGTARLAEDGYVTGGSRRIREDLGRGLKIGDGVPPAVIEAALDPQTSGGLLVSLSPRRAREYVETLHDRGLRPAIVGRVEKRPKRSPVTVAIA